MENPEQALMRDAPGNGVETQESDPLEITPFAAKAQAVAESCARGDAAASTEARARTCMSVHLGTSLATKIR